MRLWSYIIKMYYNNIPKLDIHGYDSKSAIALVDSFVISNYEAGYNEICVIHGIGKNVLKEELYKYLQLKKDIVNCYKLNINNIGETVIYLNEIN